MGYALMADLVVAAHLAFVGFAALGGLAVLRWHRLAWVHLPAVVWAVGIEWSGGVCPLTPLEHWLRVMAGTGGYDADFVGRYLLPVLYPAGLTRAGQLVLGGLVLAINGAVYGWLWHKRRKPRL